MLQTNQEVTTSFAQNNAKYPHDCHSHCDSLPSLQSTQGFGWKLGLHFNFFYCTCMSYVLIIDLSIYHGSIMDSSVYHGVSSLSPWKLLWGTSGRPNQGCLGPFIKPCRTGTDGPGWHGSQTCQLHQIWVSKKHGACTLKIANVEWNHETNLATPGLAGSKC